MLKPRRLGLGDGPGQDVVLVRRIAHALHHVAFFSERGDLGQAIAHAGLIQRIANTNRYQLTPQGLKVAMFSATSCALMPILAHIATAAWQIFSSLT